MRENKAITWTMYALTRLHENNYEQAKKNLHYAIEEIEIREQKFYNRINNAIPRRKK